MQTCCVADAGVVLIVMLPAADIVASDGLRNCR